MLLKYFGSHTENPIILYAYLIMQLFFVKNGGVFLQTMFEFVRNANKNVQFVDYLYRSHKLLLEWTMGGFFG